ARHGSLPREPAGTARGVASADGRALSGYVACRSLRARRRRRGRRNRSDGGAVVKSPGSFLRDDSDSGVATITLNRPDRLNALTFEIYDELRHTFRALSTEPGVRAVVITGTGKAFCSGGDVREIIGRLIGREYRELLEFTRMTCDLVLAIRQCRRPCIAEMSGTTAGAGAVIAAACDIRIAAASARIAFLFAKVGLSGADLGGAWLLQRIRGRRT